MRFEEWDASADPRQMLESLPDPINSRNVRLFACACCRRVQRWLSYPEAVRALEVAELFSVGRADAEEMNDAYNALNKKDHELATSCADLAAR